jgi:hypothetical protein
MIKHIKKALSLFSKKKEEIDPASAKEWPFPVGHEPQLVAKKKPALKKATTRKKVVAKKATTVAKKKTKAKSK